MNVYRLNERLGLIDVTPPVARWGEFIGPYVLGRERVAVIDVGGHSSAGFLLDGLKALEIDARRVSHVLLTHVHLDHAGAAGELLKSLPNGTVVVHPRGAPHLVSTGRLWEGSVKALGDLAAMYGRPLETPAERVVAAEDGMRIGLDDGLEIEVIHTPGHAAHHMSFLIAETGMLFAGEAGGVYTSSVDLLRPATPSPFLYERTIASVDKLLERGPKTICYAHFGAAEDAAGNLRRYREQISLWREVIGEALEAGASPELILLALMERDDNLSGLKRLSADEYRREAHFMPNSILGFSEYLSRTGLPLKAES